MNDPSPSSMHEQTTPYGQVAPQAPRPAGPGPLGRLVAIIITAGLAWAIVIALGAWLVGLLIARG